MEFTINIRSKIIISGYKNRIKQTDSIVDIGCGNGFIARNLKNHFKCKITGTDIMNYLEWDMPFFKVKDDFKLSCKNKQFNVAVINDVLHHCEKDVQVKLIKEALRVSEKVLIFETKPTIIAKVIDVLLNKIHSADMPVPLTHKNMSEWKKVFEKLGVKYEVAMPKVPFYYPIKHYVFELKK